MPDVGGRYLAPLSNVGEAAPISSFWDPSGLNYRTCISNFPSTWLGNLQWHFWQTNHGAHTNLGTQLRSRTRQTNLTRSLVPSVSQATNFVAYARRSVYAYVLMRTSLNHALGGHRRFHFISPPPHPIPITCVFGMKKSLNCPPLTDNNILLGPVH